MSCCCRTRSIVVHWGRRCRTLQGYGRWGYTHIEPEGGPKKKYVLAAPPLNKEVASYQGVRRARPRAITCSPRPDAKQDADPRDDRNSPSPKPTRLEPPRSPANVLRPHSQPAVSPRSDLVGGTDAPSPTSVQIRVEAVTPRQDADRPRPWSTPVR